MILNNVWQVVVELAQSFVLSVVPMFVTVKSFYRTDSEHTEYNATVIASQGAQQLLLVCKQMCLAKKWRLAQQTGAEWDRDRLIEEMLWLEGWPRDKKATEETQTEASVFKYLRTVVKMRTNFISVPDYNINPTLIIQYHHDASPIPQLKYLMSCSIIKTFIDPDTSISCVIWERSAILNQPVGTEMRSDGNNVATGLICLISAEWHFLCGHEMTRLVEEEDLSNVTGGTDT